MEKIYVGILASQGWWEAWQPSPKVTGSYQWSETKLEDPQVSLG